MNLYAVTFIIFTILQCTSGKTQRSPRENGQYPPPTTMKSDEPMSTSKYPRGSDEGSRTTSKYSGGSKEGPMSTSKYPGGSDEGSRPTSTFSGNYDGGKETNSNPGGDGHPTTKVGYGYSTDNASKSKPQNPDKTTTSSENQQTPKTTRKHGDVPNNTKPPPKTTSSQGDVPNNTKPPPKTTSGNEANPTPSPNDDAGTQNPQADETNPSENASDTTGDLRNWNGTWNEERNSSNGTKNTGSTVFLFPKFIVVPFILSFCM